MDPTGARDRTTCATPGCCSDVSRRQFIKVAGAGVASLSLSQPLARAVQPESRPPGEIQHFVPANKNLSAEWIQGLLTRGERAAYRGAELDTIGMPVGGVAAGQLYLRGDGTLSCWQIFNQDYFSGYGATNYQRRTPDSPVDQGFAILVDSEGQRRTKRLNRADFPGVEFSGEYPIGRVRYKADDIQLNVELEAFSPFIPGSAKDSALPATLLHVTIENGSPRPMTAQLVAWLENAVCFHTAPDIRGLRRSRIVSEKDRTLIVHTAEEAPPEEGPPPRAPIVLADFEGDDYGEWTATGEAFGKGPPAGTLPNQQKVSGFLGRGLVNTYLGGDKSQGTLTSPLFAISRKFINVLVGGGEHPGETCINLLVDGKVTRTATGRNNERLLWSSWNVEELDGKEARIEIVDRHSGGWGHVNIDQIELSDERRQGPSGPLDKLPDCGSMVLAFDGHAASPAQCAALLPHLPEALAHANFDSDASYPIGQKRPTGLVTDALALEPGARRTLTFVLAWHFPNRETGQAYANHFADASAVAHYVLDNHTRLASDTRTWHETHYDSTLPRWLLDRIGSTVSNLATGTCQWWKDGRFWAWEGVGCCEGTCTHVWNYAQALARLFPELERSVREMQDLGVAFHENGLVGFRGNDVYAADGQAGTILKCYREHLLSADGAFLSRNWPKIRKALEYSIEQDADDDGLIENSQHNTYDINFEGPNTFVGALYLAALRAGEELARELDEGEFADRLRRVFESGRRLSIERLWNEEYFIQRVDLEKHPKNQYGDGCLSDQLFGQSWAHQLALGHLYPAGHVRTALRSIWKYNWAPDIGPQNAAHKPERWFATPGEAGLFVCTWPKGAYPAEGVRYREEVWTGIEYQVAAHMIWEGMLPEALAILRGVHERYHPAKRNPFNEVECGDHYARALASWGVLTALCGFEYHGPKGHIGFAPRITPDNFRAAFTAAEGWGAFDQKREAGSQRARIELRWGRLRLRTLAFELPEAAAAARVSAAVAGQSIKFEQMIRGTRLEITLERDLILRAGETLEVVIA